jgi:hypothetical protein
LLMEQIADPGRKEQVSPLPLIWIHMVFPGAGIPAPGKTGVNLLYCVSSVPYQLMP